MPNTHQHVITYERTPIKAHNNKTQQQLAAQHGTKTISFNNFIFIGYN
jgi:hypothetical protein